MEKLSRKDLKHDQFVESVGHSVEYAAAHRRQLMMYGGAALAALVIGLIIYSVRSSSQQTRQTDLAEALRAKEGVVTVGGSPDDPRRSFPTQVDKDRAVQKAFQDLATKHAGTNEASLGYFQLGTMAADAGKMDEAVKHFQDSIQAGNREYASAARLSLAQVLSSQGKVAEAEKILRELISSPTILVSHEQATVTLARVLGPTRAAEARKLLEPLEKDSRPVIARTASSLAAELPK